MIAILIPIYLPLISNPNQRQLWCCQNTSTTSPSNNFIYSPQVFNLYSSHLSKYPTERGNKIPTPVPKNPSSIPRPPLPAEVPSSDIATANHLFRIQPDDGRPRSTIHPSRTSRPAPETRNDSAFPRCDYGALSNADLHPDRMITEMRALEERLLQLRTEFTHSAEQSITNSGGVNSLPVGSLASFHPISSSLGADRHFSNTPYHTIFSQSSTPFTKPAQTPLAHENTSPIKLNSNNPYRELHDQPRQFPVYEVFPSRIDAPNNQRSSHPRYYIVVPEHMTLGNLARLEQQIGVDLNESVKQEPPSKDSSPRDTEAESSNSSGTPPNVNISCSATTTTCSPQRTEPILDVSSDDSPPAQILSSDVQREVTTEKPAPEPPPESIEMNCLSRSSAPSNLTPLSGSSQLQDPLIPMPAPRPHPYISVTINLNSNLIFPLLFAFLLYTLCFLFHSF
ncbi:hypothetical protein BDQ12DRAFT_726719 [Crucibulum laeve]|uniref:Uncharacterized protein n=1 Tax=Crucibulum laeve TaxID=68775 RepID=A0A5C3LP53_9AGAR|nr:hypothetical protein BDQ12DRAFT_726719 [Crucibulum laeve]